MIMKRNLFTTMAIFLLLTAKAQQFTVEGLVGDKYLFYQHLFSKKVEPSSRWGVMHIANVINRYEHDTKKGGMPNELMNQAYIAMQLSKKFSLLTGMFYNNVNGIRASAGVQFAHSFKQGLFIMVPRMDVQMNGSFELMGMLEYRPEISGMIKLYSRIQVMSNYGPYHHNRSYQRLRLGLDIKDIQLGVAVNLDEYGYSANMKANTGVFIRKVF